MTNDRVVTTVCDIEGRANTDRRQCDKLIQTTADSDTDLITMTTTTTTAVTIATVTMTTVL